MPQSTPGGGAGGSWGGGGQRAPTDKLLGWSGAAPGRVEKKEALSVLPALGGF